MISRELQTLIDDGMKAGQGLPEIEQTKIELRNAGLTAQLDTYQRMTAVYHAGGMLPASEVASFARSLKQAAPVAASQDKGALMQLSAYDFSEATKKHGAISGIVKLLTMDRTSPVCKMIVTTANGPTVVNAIRLGSPGAAEAIARAKGTPTPLDAKNHAPQYYGKDIEKLIATGTAHGGLTLTERAQLSQYIAFDGTAAQADECIRVCASVPKDARLGPDKLATLAKAIGYGHAVHSPITEPVAKVTPAAPAIVQPPVAKRTFPQLIADKMAAGFSKGDAVASVVASHPDAHIAWLNGKGSALNGAELARPEVKATGFAQIVAGFVTAGHSKSEAVMAAMKTYPAEYSHYLHNGGGKL